MSKKTYQRPIVRTVRKPRPGRQVRPCRIDPDTCGC